MHFLFKPAQKPTSLPANHPLRKPILDGLRALVEKDIKQKVIFRVTTLRVLGDFAFVQCEPRTPADKPIDFKKTRYKSDIEQGAWDGPTCYGLVRKTKGKWIGVVHVIGPTDVAWSEWTEKPYNAPKTLLFPDGL